MNIVAIIKLIGEVGALVGILSPIVIGMRKISAGTKCQLRSEMLRIYYHNYQDGYIRQYEYENFVALYEAYKALGGNSFIDKIYSEIKTWEVIT